MPQTISINRNANAQDKEGAAVISEHYDLLEQIPTATIEGCEPPEILTSAKTE